MTRSRKNATKWNVLFHYYNIAFNMVWGVLLVPLYLKYIPLEIYGAWLATGNILAWLTVVDPGISDVLRQKVGEAYGDGARQKLNDLLGSGILLSLVISLFVLFAGVISSKIILNFISIQDTGNFTIIQHAFILAVIGSALTIFSSGITSFNIGLLSSLGIGSVFVVATISSLIVNIIFLMKGYGLYSIPISVIVRAIILLAGNTAYALWRFTKENLEFKLSFHDLKAFTALTGYNFFARIGSVLVSNIDAFIVARFIGAEMAPVLVLTKKGPELSRMFIERPVTAMLPALTNARASGEMEKIRQYTMRLFLILLWLLGLLITGFTLLNKTFVEFWVGKELFAGTLVNFIIVIGLPLYILVNVSSNILFSFGFIKKTSRITFIQSIITVIFIFAGTKYYGILGLVASQIIALMLLSAWYFPINAFKELNFNKSHRTTLFIELLKVLGVDILLIFAGNYLVEAENWNQFILNCTIILISYFGLLYSISKNFRNEFKGILLFKNRKSKNAKI